MAGCCQGHCNSTTNNVPARYRKALWIALIINAAMFAVEIAGSMHSGAVSLLADAIDFAGDAANYGISLAVLSMGLLWRAKAAWIKGVTMTAYGVFVLLKTIWAAVNGVPPEPLTMGLIGLLALMANLSVAIMLYAFRSGDANMRSVWLCSRNDAITNIAIMIAAFGVFKTATMWPDLIVALIISALSISAGLSIIQQSRKEIISVQP